MPIRRLILLIVVAAALVACGGAPGLQNSSTRTAAPAASTGAATSMAAPTAAQAATFEGLASGLDNATQARIRIANGVTGAPQVDVFINGLLAFNAGKPQQNIDVGHFSGWLYVTSGAYTIALVSHGGPLIRALFAPVAVNAAAGHRYTVAAVGEQKNIKSLVIDETALEAGIGIKPTS